MTQSVFNVAFVGTGNIAGVHADSIKVLPSTRLVAVYDPNQAAAESFAKRYGAQAKPLEAILADPAIHAIHVLTPPDTHGALVNQFASSGKSLLVEKPIATTAADVELLKALQLKPGQLIGVNQNMVFHPAMAELRSKVESGQFGQLRQFDLTFRPALRQLSAMQFSHWMFRSQLNLLLEQAVHPVSQLLALMGKPTKISAVASDHLRINSENSTTIAFSASMQFDKISGSLNFGVGALYPVWKLTAYCDDGVIEADMVCNVTTVFDRTAFIDPLDQAISMRRSSKQRASKAWRNLVDYSKATVGLGSRSDSFFLGIRNSLDHFYGALAGRHKLITDVAFGLQAVQVCQDLDQKLGAPPSPKTAAATVAGTFAADSSLPTVAVIGASGFIGRATTELLVSKGFKVKASARTVTNLGDIFKSPQVELVKANVRLPEDLDRAIAGCTYVINLAHGGGGANYEEIKRALVDSAVLVAKKSAEHGVKRVLHIGSIAGLYLGDPNEVVTGATPPDPQPEVRGDYARAKALADLEFASACKAAGIEYVVLRPGVVVGKGTHPLHAGLGFFNNEGHVVGWSEGMNPIPFVEVNDVASAIVLSMLSPKSAGKSYNVAGDLDISVREYIAHMNKTMKRKVVFHPKTPRRLWFEDVLKNMIKRAGGRKAPFPNIRDFNSRAMYAKLDCSDLKADTGWQPLNDKAQFFSKVFG